MGSVRSCHLQCDLAPDKNFFSLPHSLRLCSCNYFFHRKRRRNLRDELKRVEPKKIGIRCMPKRMSCHKDKIIDGRLMQMWILASSSRIVLDQVSFSALLKYTPPCQRCYVKTFSCDAPSTSLDSSGI